MLLMAVDCEEKAGDESREDLNHKAMLASGYQVVNFEVPFPPGEKFLDIPAQFINLGDLFGSQVKAVCGHPILYTADLVADQAKRLFCLVDAGLSQQDLGIEKDDAVWR